MLPTTTHKHLLRHWPGAWTAPLNDAQGRSPFFLSGSGPCIELQQPDQRCRGSRQRLRDKVGVLQRLTGGQPLIRVVPDVWKSTRTSVGKCGMCCQTQGRSYGGAGHEVRDMSHVSYLSDEALHVRLNHP